MAETIILSFLGTNNYQTCSYVFPDTFESTPTPFFQEAIAEWFYGLQNPCTMIVCATDQAVQSNWESGDRYSGKGLEQRLRDFNSLGFRVELCTIPTCTQSHELWDLFNIVYNKVPEHCNLHIDLTHAFRTIPLIVSTIVPFLTTMKDVKPLSLLYGAFEASQDTDQVASKRVPVFDMSDLYVLQQWNSAVDSFSTTGNPAMIRNLVCSKANSLVRMNKADPVLAENEKKLLLTLEKIQQDLATSRGLAIRGGDSYVCLAEIIDKLRGVEFLSPPMNQIIHKIEKDFSLYTRDSSENLIRAVEYCSEKGLIQQGITLLQESLVSYFLEKLGFKIDERSLRYTMGALLSGYSNPKGGYGMANDLWSEEVANSFLKLRVTFPEKIKRFVNEYCSIRDYRNDMNHAGFTKDANASRSFKKKLDSSLKTIKELLEL